MTASEWTLDELIGRVAEELDGTTYAGAPNGRVRDVPDARAVRWYTTIGLVDRPIMRGRTAWYGPRHLTQLVAVKRRQSQGFKIAEIQAELAEAPDEVLQRIAERGDPPPRGTPERFWTQRPAIYEPLEHHHRPHHSPEPIAAPVTTGLLSGVPLGGGAVLLLHGTPSEDDLEAIRDAARELMDLLATRGLVTPDETTTRRGNAR
ncbi:MerR family transcriptional regulator [Dactylosporangium sp. NPDC051541]|uniref:MerR family transcriptional regulator n=1 Tax=Dactylosporangium sp. NPDC051541 TaxID=3363977 RepID=UPI003799B973